MGIWSDEADVLCSTTAEGKANNHAALATHLSSLTRVYVPPATFFSKVHVDAAVSRAHNKGAAATVCRDDMGNYVGSSALVIEGITDEATLEAIA